MATMQFEHVVFLETVFIYKHLYALTSRVLAAGVLLLDGFLTTAKTSLLTFGHELLDLLCLLTHN
jgi:hypothetical protein